ncbi:hypothetical protein RCC89_10450 [Cytophagaceae bacterium ABcell3]|nr:hypothetical protein RCC89_10450 [Cytophagaceae bacterium ABcell3]
MSNTQMILGAIGVIILIAAGVAYNTIDWVEGLILIVLMIIVIPLLSKFLKRVPRRDERHHINDDDDYK